MLQCSWRRVRVTVECHDSPPELQSLAALGAKVIAAAGSQEKLDVSIRLGGADHGVNYTKEGWQKEVLGITKGKGVDVVYDPVGRIKGKIREGATRRLTLIPR